MKKAIIFLLVTLPIVFFVALYRALKIEGALVLSESVWGDDEVHNKHHNL